MDSEFYPSTLAQRELGAVNHDCHRGDYNYRDRQFGVLSEAQTNELIGLIQKFLRPIRPWSVPNQKSTFRQLNHRRRRMKYNTRLKTGWGRELRTGREWNLIGTESHAGPGPKRRTELGSKTDVGSGLQSNV
ncbi:hypothetical protein EVAR_27095_1 [Eumeta japonica]|uniref:Uncharacterized protein n=1 Tax=Eumeta variegata TaxID=151549 RepID=A0A4C1VMZ2_EUMVA|nr:hypothetical protein EVAR_27095_1 [Eumeta japonica]